MESLVNIQDIRDQFVRVLRIEETTAWEECLRSMRGGGTPVVTVFVFHGPTGIGKSHLLKELRRWTEAEGIPWTWVNFDHDEVDARYDDDAGQIALLKDLQERLAQSLALKGTPLLPEQTNPTKAEHFLEYARSVQSFYNLPIAIFLDTLEECQSVNLSWLEKNVLSPLLIANRTAIAVGSRRHQEWEEFDIRRRTQEWELTPFNDEATQAQVGRLVEAGAAWQFADRMRKLTAGLPGANLFVAEQLYQAQHGAQIKPETLDDPERLMELRTELVEEYLFRKVQDTGLRAIILRLAPLRQFDYSLLQQFLPEFLPDIYKGQPFRVFRKLVTDLLGTTLVEWSPPRRGYAVQDAVRYILSAYLHAHESDTYRQINQFAAAWFKEEVFAKGNFFYIVDRLYHVGQLWSQPKSDPALGKLLITEMTICLDRLEQIRGTDATREADLIAKGLAGDDLVSALSSENLVSLRKLVEARFGLSDHA